MLLPVASFLYPTSCPSHPSVHHVTLTKFLHLIPHGSDCIHLVSAVVLRVVLLPLLHAYFHPRQEAEVFPQESHATERSPQPVGEHDKNFMLFLSTANGSLSKCPRVPSWPRKAVVWKQQATVCPVLCLFRRIDIPDHVPRT